MCNMDTVEYYLKHYSEQAVRAAQAYVENVHHNDEPYKLTRQKLADELPENKRVLINLLEVNAISKDDVLSAYLYGMRHAVNANMSKEEISPIHVSEYTKNKDFAFYFYFCDNDFGGYIQTAAQHFCDEYNGILHSIDMYSHYDSSGANSMVDSYIQQLGFMEDKDNLKEMLMSLFVGAFMSESADRAYCFGTTKYSHNKRIEEAQRFVEYLFTEIDDRIVTGTWEEVRKNGEERFEELQYDMKPEDFSKYWINGEVLIVRMVNGLLVPEIR